MIRLSNGYEFEYLAASGALGYGGRGWLHERLFSALRIIKLPYQLIRVSKTLTMKSNKGNGKFTTIRLIKGGSVNAMGLPNPGLRWWCDKIGPRLDSSKVLLIVSLHSSDPKKFGQMAQAVNGFGLIGIEINISCPNICSSADRATRH